MICLEPMRRQTWTPCGHVFCYDCIITWLSECGMKPTCPVDRREVRFDVLVVVKKEQGQRAGGNVDMDDVSKSAS